MNSIYDHIPKNTRVITCIEDLQIIGVVVGKASDSITESYIIKCIDGQLPNSVYQYDIFISPMRYITMLDTSFGKWEKFYNIQQDIKTKMPKEE